MPKLFLSFLLGLCLPFVFSAGSGVMNPAVEMDDIQGGCYGYKSDLAAVSAALYAVCGCDDKLYEGLIAVAGKSAAGVLGMNGDYVWESDVLDPRERVRLRILRDEISVGMIDLANEEIGGQEKELEPIKIDPEIMASNNGI